MSHEIDLDPRSLTIIKALVDEYVSQGKPVASHKIAAKRGINLSSASVRNVLARLEQSGLIEQVHTSSGRRPTATGMHIYLNSLLQVQKPPQESMDLLVESLRTESTNTMVHSAMEAVANLTQMVTLVSLPGVSESRLTNVQFMRLSAQRVMAVMITDTGEVRNRLLELNKEIDSRQLELAGQCFSEHFSGKTMVEARHELRGRISTLQTSIAELLQHMLNQITDSDSGHEVLTSGTQQPAMVVDAQRLSNMTALLHSKETLLRILDHGVGSNDVSVFIGVESGIPELDDSSVVMAPYHDEESNVVGVLGLIGPLNMKYAKVMPLVQLTTTLMNDALVKIRQEYS